MRNPVVVVGMGVVGQATARILLRSGFKVIGVDVLNRRRIPRWTSKHYRAMIDWRTELPLLERHTYVLCLPTPTSVSDGTDRAYWTGGGYQETSALDQTLYALSGLRCRVVLRSTVLPEAFRDPLYQRVDYVWPEFLHMQPRARIAHDTDYPDYEVVGCRDIVEIGNFPFASPALRYRRHPRLSAIGTREQAMALKYLHNAWNALRVAFVNEMSDTMSDAGVQRPDDIINLYFGGADYLRPGDPFAGACLPKDVAAWVGVHRHRAAILDAATYSNLLRDARGRAVPLRLAPPGTDTITLSGTNHTVPALPPPAAPASEGEEATA